MLQHLKTKLSPCIIPLIAISILFLESCEKKNDSSVSPLDTLAPGEWHKIADSESHESQSGLLVKHYSYFPVNKSRVIRSADKYLSPSSGSRATNQYSNDGGFNWGHAGGAGSHFYRYFHINQDSLACLFRDELNYPSSLYFSFDGGYKWNGGNPIDDDGPSLWMFDVKSLDFSNTGLCYFITETPGYGYYLGKFNGNQKTKIYSDTVTSKASFNLSVISDSLFYFTRQNQNIAALYRSSGGGQSFQSTPLPTQQKVNALHFFNKSEGLIVANAGQLYHTTDGGLNWNRLNFPSTANIKSFRQQNGKFYILTADDEIFDSNDGLNWNLFDQPPIKNIENFLYFGSPENGFITIKGALYRKHDGK